MIRVIQNTTSRHNEYMDAMAGKIFTEYEYRSRIGYYRIKDKDGYNWSFLPEDIEVIEQSEDDLFRRRLLD